MLALHVTFKSYGYKAVDIYFYGIYQTPLSTANYRHALKVLFINESW